MNLAYYYPTIMWSCACLSVDANAVDENDYTFIEEVADYWIDDEEDEPEDEWDEEATDKKKKTSKVNYDKIASALGRFKDKVIIKLPDINKARMGFIPDTEDNSIMFGFKGISRIGDDIIANIIANRPYNSIQDFLDKMVVDGKKLISKDRVVNLIKAGCFDNIEKSNRSVVMERFINELVPRKKTLNLRNMDKLIEYDLIPEEFNFQKGVYLFTKEARKRRDKVNGYYNLDEIMVLWFRKWMKKEPPMLDGEYKVNSAKWDNYYDKTMDTIRVWIKSNLNELIEAFHKVEYEAEFNKYAVGSELKWELDSLNFYHSGHPLTELTTPITTTPLDQIVDGEFDGYWNIKGNIVPKMVVRSIVGTVLVKNNQKKIIILSTPHGVVQVKIYKTQFAKFDKVIKDANGDVIQDSFLKKGNHLLLTGILRDGVFIPKVYKDTGHEPIRRILINEDGSFLCFEDKL